MTPSDILFCIFNYHDAANAQFLYHELRPTFQCHIIDADSGEKPDPCGGDTIYLPNVYYSGMMHQAITMAKEGHYPYLFFICSDVRMTIESIDTLKHILLSETFEGVGVYSPAHADDSYTWVAWSYSRGTNKRRSVSFAEGMIGMYAQRVYNQLEPLNRNPHGWGLDLVACFYARHWGLRCEIDDRLTITHPKGDTRKNTLARTEARQYLMGYPEGHAIRRFWVRCSIQNATIQPFILPHSYPTYLRLYLPIYRFFHQR